MKKTITILSCTILAATSLFVLTACNTTKGIGQDIEATGSAISGGAAKVQDEM
jgi:entericidin B